MSGRLFVLALWLAAITPAWAQDESEDFPGQKDLAAGLACHQDLDLDCAQNRLESALARFRPERDPAYMQHVRTARMLLATIHVARDNLQRAEQEFKTLLLLDPDFDLPPGEQPPKVRYVLQQARQSLRSAESGKDNPAPAATPGIEAGDDTADRPYPATESAFELEVGPRLVGLFGDDAQTVSSGPGGVVNLGWRSPVHLGTQLQLAYAYHPRRETQAETLQALSVTATGWYEISLEPLAIRLGGGLGSLAMGTRDRYDHWGVLAQLVIDCVWPARGRFALVLQIQPSMLFTADGSSVFLPVGLSGALRW